MTRVNSLLIIIMLGFSFAQASEVSDYIDDRQSINLVVGSTRQDTIPENTIISNLLCTPETDLTHRSSFGGQATTLDLQKSKCPDLPHIVADAGTYDFSNYIINNVYLERLFTIDIAGYQQDRKEDDYKSRSNHFNILKNIINNIYPRMLNGSKMEIEWAPCISLYGSQKLKEHEIDANPFHCFQNFNIATLSIQHALNCQLDWRQILQASSPECILLIKNQGDRVKKLLDLYRISGIQEDALKISSRLNFDIWCLNNLRTTQGYLFLNCRPIAPFQEFEQAILTCYIAPQRSPNCFSLSSYLSDSLTGQILSDLAVEDNWPLVKDYLESIDFKNVTLEHKESPHNHRRNVWIITGFKS